MGGAESSSFRRNGGSALASRCPGCGLEMPAQRCAYDGYFNVSPACWSVFCEVLGTEYQNAAVLGDVHQLTVDAYAVQHAGGPHPDKSVCVHLYGLHLVLVAGRKPADVPAQLQQLASARRDWPHFEPPVDRGELTVLDVAGAAHPAEHVERVRAWSSAVWSSWSAHHAAIARLGSVARTVRSP